MDINEIRQGAKEEDGIPGTDIGYFYPGKLRAMPRAIASNDFVLS